MKNRISVAVALVAFAVWIVGWLPFFGWLNYYVVVLAIISAIFGFMSKRTSGRNLSVFVLILAGIRLFMVGNVL